VLGLPEVGNLLLQSLLSVPELKHYFVVRDCPSRIEGRGFSSAN
jgi:hypothetical protein